MSKPTKPTPIGKTVVWSWCYRFFTAVLPFAGLLYLFGEVAELGWFTSVVLTLCVLSSFVAASLFVVISSLI
jgi:hypothetical protein